MHSRLLYHFCVVDDEAGAFSMLNTFDDIDVLYEEGAIIELIVAKNKPQLLQAVLDYFETKQFPHKGPEYEAAHEKLVEILENTGEGIDSTSEINAVISKYVGSDVAVLDEVFDAEELVLLRQGATEHTSSLTLSSLALHDSTIESLKDLRSVISEYIGCNIRLLDGICDDDLGVLMQEMQQGDLGGLLTLRFLVLHDSESKLESEMYSQHEAMATISGLHDDHPPEICV